MARITVARADERSAAHAAHAGGHRVRSTAVYARQERRGTGRPRWRTWALARLVLAALAAFLLRERAPVVG